jgi:hypothetical protein
MLDRVCEGPVAVKERKIVPMSKAKLTKFRFHDRKMILSIPKEWDDVSVSLTGKVSILLISGKSEKWSASMIMDPQREQFCGEFLSTYNHMLRSLNDPAAAKKLEGSFMTFLTGSDEEIFRRCLLQTKKILATAGSDKEKLVAAFLGLTLRADLLWGKVDKCELVTLKRNRVYIGPSPNYPKTHVKMWIFDGDGLFLGELIVSSKKLTTGLQIADSVERMKRPKKKE